MRQIVLIAHNLRSSHNVGSIIRTAECLGVDKIYLTGYTPFPYLQGCDPRLPHIAHKVQHQINKTALGTQDLIEWEREENIVKIIKKLRSDGFEITALEQAGNSVPIHDYFPAEKTSIIVGREVEGLEIDVLTACDKVVEIPMAGHKESLNVAQAAAIGLYHAANYQRIISK